MFYNTPDLTTIKDMFRKIYLLVLLAAALACKASPSKPVQVSEADLQPDEQQIMV
jgi:carboxyl-terminal processing protease